MPSPYATPSFSMFGVGGVVWESSLNIQACGEEWYTFPVVRFLLVLP